MTTSKPIVDSIYEIEPQLGNLRAYWLSWGSSDDPADDLQIFRSGLPHPLLNGVTRLRKRPLDEAVAEARHRLDGVPGVWWVGPDSDPGVEDGLLARGLEAGSILPVMAIELDNIPEVSGPAGLVIEQLTDTATLTEYVQAYSGPFSIPETALAAVVDAESERNEPARFVGRIDGQTVATSELFVSHGVAGIYWVSTLEQQRGQGIGAALTAAALRAGRERGLRVATLQASGLGQPVYRRLGFTTVSRYRHLML
jgi:ribosomal protein S18 acetylase RimI-like enzyme